MQNDTRPIEIRLREAQELGEWVSTFLGNIATVNEHMSGNWANQGADKGRASVQKRQEPRLPFKQEGWLPHGLACGQLLNLLQMLEVYALEYIAIGSAIQSIKDTFGVDVALEENVPESVLTRVTRALADILGRGRELKLAVSVNIADKAFQNYRQCLPPSYRQVGDDIQCLERALRAELETRRFFFVPPERANYYSDEGIAFLDENDGLADKLTLLRPAIKSFPSITNELREAGNCFAFDRPTACVFHLARVMEAALKVTARELGVGYTTDWGRCFRDIEKQGEQSDPFFREAVAYLRSFKNVWRNPTMHIERSFSEQEAEHIFNAVQAFMVHLATRLTE